MRKLITCLSVLALVISLALGATGCSSKLSDVITLSNALDKTMKAGGFQLEGDLQIGLGNDNGTNTLGGIAVTSTIAKSADYKNMKSATAFYLQPSPSALYILNAYSNFNISAKRPSYSIELAPDKLMASAMQKTIFEDIVHQRVTVTSGNTNNFGIPSNPADADFLAADLQPVVDSVMSSVSTVTKEEDCTASDKSADNNTFIVHPYSMIIDASQLKKIYTTLESTLGIGTIALTPDYAKNSVINDIETLLDSPTFAGTYKLTLGLGDDGYLRTVGIELNGDDTDGKAIEFHLMTWGFCNSDQAFKNVEQDRFDTAGFYPLVYQEVFNKVPKGLYRQPRAQRSDRAPKDSIYPIFTVQEDGSIAVDNGPADQQQKQADPVDYVPTTDDSPNGDQVGEIITDTTTKTIDVDDTDYMATTGLEAGLCSKYIDLAFDGLSYLYQKTGSKEQFIIQDGNIYISKDLSDKLGMDFVSLPKPPKTEAANNTVSQPAATPANPTSTVTTATSDNNPISIITNKADKKKVVGKTVFLAIKGLKATIYKDHLTLVSSGRTIQYKRSAVNDKAFIIIGSDIYVTSAIGKQFGVKYPPK